MVNALTTTPSPKPHLLQVSRIPPNHSCDKNGKLVVIPGVDSARDLAFLLFLVRGEGNGGAIERYSRYTKGDIVGWQTRQLGGSLIFNIFFFNALHRDCFLALSLS